MSIVNHCEISVHDGKSNRQCIEIFLYQKTNHPITTPIFAKNSNFSLSVIAINNNMTHLTWKKGDGELFLELSKV